MMSLICIVCRDPLTTNPETESHDGVASKYTGGAGAPPLPEMIVTRCGHTYHYHCLTRWFNRSENPRQECPYCKSPVPTNAYQKIFCVGDEDLDEILAANQSLAKSRETELISLKTQQEEISLILTATQFNLESEQLHLDLLKYEYACQESENLALKTDKENLEMQIGIMSSKILELEMRVGKLNEQLAEAKAELELEKNIPGGIGEAETATIKSAVMCLNRTTRLLQGLTVGSASAGGRGRGGAEPPVVIDLSSGSSSSSVQIESDSDPEVIGVFGTPEGHNSTSSSETGPSWNLVEPIQT